MKILLKKLSLIGLMVSMPIYASSTLSTATIIEQTLQALPNCLQYQIIGTCYWLNCTFGVCKIVPTLRVAHYLPDLVVGAYQQYGSNPWDYANMTVDRVAYQAGNSEVNMMMHTNLGNGDESSSAVNNDTHFKEVDVIGNPALSAIKMTDKLLIQSSVTPFFPYYLSLADAYAWRTPAIEMTAYPAYLLPGVHVVGSLMNVWGSLYPRTGFILQPQDGKAAAVLALRAVDIASYEHQPHLYHPLSKSCGTACDISDVKENDENTKWQMVYPILQTTCSVFGANDFTQPLPWGSEASQEGKGNYVWVMWRHYKGCIPGSGKYLGHT